MAHMSIVVPVFRAEGTLRELYTRLRTVVCSINPDYEFVFVEDCGGDQSWDIILDICKTDARVKAIRFSRNFGQHHGITAGIDHCDGNWVVVMDCDLQDQPEDIPRLYDKAQQGFDVVIGRRAERKDSAIKRFYSWCFYRVLGYLTDSIYDSRIGNFRIMSRRAMVQVRAMREQVRFFVGLVQWIGFPSATIDVEHAERKGGKSTYTFAKQWQLATDAMIAYSDKPLKLAIRLGFGTAFLSISLGAGLIYGAFFHGRDWLTGWASLMVSIYFIGGVIIAILGIIGVYLGKTFDEVKRRPIYVVRDTANL